jgi:ribosomal protein S6--L-glutamate ligase
LLIEHEHDGMPFLNRPSVVREVHDKAQALRRLADAGMDVPPTVFIKRDDVASLDALDGDVFVVKPATGAAGRGVTMNLDRRAALRSAIAFADASGPVLVQPALGEGIDRRLFVVAGKIVAAMERRPARPGERGSLHYGAEARKMEPSPAECDLALSAADLFGLDVAGVDLLRHDGRSIVLEVNACPGVEGIQTATGTDAAASIAEEVVRRLQVR